MPDEQYKDCVWSFPTSTGIANITGRNGLPDVHFRRNAHESLAREICQNSIDANKDKKLPTRIEFSLFSVKTEKIPGVEEIKQNLSSAIDFWNRQGNKTNLEFLKSAKTSLEKAEVSVLRISDFNTVGLRGSDSDSLDNDWHLLTQMTGSSNKSDAAGGSYGLGKSTSFGCSKSKIVFYSTLDADKRKASIGVAMYVDYVTGEKKIEGTGYFYKKGGRTVPCQLELDPKFTRGTTGTDVYIIAFDTDEGPRSKDRWKNRIISSILNGFLYAIYKEMLIVELGDITINRENLKSLIENYSKTTDSVMDYYHILESVENETIYKIEPYPLRFNNENLGQMHLWLRSGNGLNGMVAMIREMGMKIYDEKRFQSLSNFSGIAFFEGERLNRFLKGLEGPNHNKWSTSSLPSEKKSEADALMNKIKEYINTEIKKLLGIDSSAEINPLEDDDDLIIEEKHTNKPISDVIKAIYDSKSKINNAHKISESVDQEISVASQNGMPEGLEQSPYNPVSKEPNKDDASFSLEKQGSQTNPGRESKNKNDGAIIPSRSNIIMKNRQKGEYELKITPGRTVKNGTIAIFVSGEDEQEPIDILNAYCVENINQKIKFKNNLIENINFIKDHRLCINLEIDNDDFCTVEIKVYEQV